MTHPINQVAKFMKLGGQEFPDSPDFNLEWEEVSPFISRITEEVTESLSSYNLADGTIDLAELVDGFIDTAYVALTAAVRAAGPEKAKQVWDAVVEANLSKVDGRFGPVVRDEETGKILKPEGWEAPDVAGILEL